MNRSRLVLTTAAALLVVAAFTSTQQAADSPPAMLKVLSAQDGKEVRFEGKYFRTGDGAFHQEIEARATPFEVEVDADEFVALFRSLNEADNIKLFVQVDEGKGTVSAEAVGNVGLILREGMKLTSSGL